jgi:excisionase family DNA binding protein
MDNTTTEVRRRRSPPARLKPHERLTYSIPEAARQLGIGINSAYAAAKNGTLPVVKIGDRLLVPRAALAAMLAKAGS